MKNICPVCGFDQLETPPSRFEICPSCGTEFGNDDYFNMHEELTIRWMADGMKWWDEEKYRPTNWSPLAQLKNIPVVTYRIKKAVEFVSATSYKHIDLTKGEDKNVNPLPVATSVMVLGNIFIAFGKSVNKTPKISPFSGSRPVTKRKHIKELVPQLT